MDSPSSPPQPLFMPLTLPVPAPPSARPRPRPRGGSGPYRRRLPFSRPARPHSPEPPGQREPLPWAAQPGPARGPRPGPPPRAMEPRPPGSRRVSHPSPPLSLAPAAAAAPPTPTPSRPPAPAGLATSSSARSSGYPAHPPQTAARPQPISGSQLVPPDCCHHTGYPRLSFPGPWSPPDHRTSHQVLHLP